MTISVTLESLFFPGVVDRTNRRRQFVAETADAPWAPLFADGDRIETSGAGRRTVAIEIQSVCNHLGGYAGLDTCLKHPARDYYTEDAHLFEVLGSAFAALQFDPDDIRSAHPGAMTAIVYTLIAE